MYGFCPWVRSGRRHSPWVRVVEFGNDTTRQDPGLDTSHIQWKDCNVHLVYYLNFVDNFVDFSLNQRLNYRNSSNTSISIRIYWTHFTTSVAASSGSKVLHSPYCSLSRIYFFTHAECCLFFFSNKLAAPKLHDSLIKEPRLQQFLCRLPSLQRLGFSRRVFLGNSTTKSGRARVVESSENQTCRRPGLRPETRTLFLVGSGPVWFGPCPSSGIWTFVSLVRRETNKVS